MEVVEIMDVVSVANLHRCRSKGYLKGSMINLPHPSDRNKQIYMGFSEMSFPRFDRMVFSDGGPLLIQYISDACV